MLTGEERAEAIVGNVQELKLVTAHHGNGGRVCRRNHIFQLLSSKNVGGGEVCLRVAVLAGLGGGYVHHLRCHGIPTGSGFQL